MSLGHNLPYFKCPSIYSSHHSHNMARICVTLWPTIVPTSSVRCALQSTVATNVISRQQFGHIVALCIHGGFTSTCGNWVFQKKLLHYFWPLILIFDALPFRDCPSIMWSVKVDGMGSQNDHFWSQGVLAWNQHVKMSSPGRWSVLVQIWFFLQRNIEFWTGPEKINSIKNLD